MKDTKLSLFYDFKGHNTSRPFTRGFEKYFPFIIQVYFVYGTTNNKIVRHCLIQIETGGVTAGLLFTQLHISIAIDFHHFRRSGWLFQFRPINLIVINGSARLKEEMGPNMWPIT